MKNVVTNLPEWVYQLLTALLLAWLATDKSLGATPVTFGLISMVFGISLMQGHPHGYYRFFPGLLMLGGLVLAIGGIVWEVVKNM